MSRSKRANFTIIPNEQLQQRLPVSMGAKTLLNVLKSYAWNAHFCFPSQGLLAEGVQCSRDSIQRYSKELVEAGLIRIKKRFGKNSFYVLLAPSLILGGEIPTCRNLPDLHTANCGTNKKQKKKTQQQQAAPPGQDVVDAPRPSDLAELHPVRLPLEEINQNEATPLKALHSSGAKAPKSDLDLEVAPQAPLEETTPPQLSPEPSAGGAARAGAGVQPGEAEAQDCASNPSSGRCLASTLLMLLRHRPYQNHQRPRFSSRS